MRSGNWALVTRKEETRRACSSEIRWLISGYIIGSPTSDRAQCRTFAYKLHRVSTSAEASALVPLSGHSNN